MSARSSISRYFAVRLMVTGGAAGLAPPLRAQQVTVPQRLSPEVTVTRERGRAPIGLPYATMTTRPDSMRSGQRHLSLDGTLLLRDGVPLTLPDG